MGWRQFAACVLGCLAAACGSDTPVLGVLGERAAANGGVAADEPVAATVAREVLSAGGTATDAAVAAYFALSVTYPAAAGLGSGGVCMAFDAQAGDVRTVDFLPRPATKTPSPGDKSVAIPGGARGMLALHARFGRLRLEQLVQPAERLARFGHRVSRALAVQVAANRHRLREDPGARRLFLREDGAPIAEGDTLVQPELAASLAGIRTRGIGDLYVGELAKRTVAGVAKLGGALDADELRGYKPAWVESVKRPFGNHEVHFPPVGQGPAAASSWDLLSEREAYSALDDGGESAQATAAVHALAKVYSPARSEIASVGSASRAGADARAEGDPPPGGGSTGLAIVDRDRGMISCAFTMTTPFGTARMIPGTGILLGEPASDAAAATFATVMMINRPTKTVQMTAAASHGPAVGGALALVALRAAVGKQTLSQAVAGPHAVPSPAQGVILIDDRGLALFDRLKSKGIAVERAGTLGLVNIVNCPGSTRRGIATCDYRADPRGFGLGAGAD